MAKGKGKKENTESRFIATAKNLAKKGKTNKKLKKNPMASKYETSENKRITEEAEKYAKAHPKGTGYKYRKLKAESKK